MPRYFKLGLAFILFIAFYFRFFNLMHDDPYFFNPDERNMAIATTQFRLPQNITKIPNCIYKELSKRNNLQDLPETKDSECALNPHFFAYGQFPLYLSFLSDQTTKPIHSKNLSLEVRSTNFSSAIYWLRFYSAMASFLTVYLVFLISKQFISPNLSLVAASFTALSPGLIQLAHFGTTESLLTFFFTLVLFLSIKLNQQITFRIIISLALSIGLAFASKFTGIFFLFPPFLIIFIKLLQSRLTKKQKVKFPVFILGLTFPLKKFIKYTFVSISILVFSYLFYRISSPYNFVEPENFRSAVFGYESDVATGKFEAFYTRQFFNTKPGLFHFQKIFPYALGWPLFISGILGLFLAFAKIFIRTKKNLQIEYLLLFSSFMVYLIPNSLLYAKWSRFMTPVLPFFAVFAGIFINQLKKSFPNNFFIILTSCFIILSFIPGTAFMSIYTNEDTRVTASEWIYENLADKSYVLSETANVVDIPLGIPNYRLPTSNYSLTVISFDFYHLNENEKLFTDLLKHLEKADYIFIPSRRIFKNHILQPEKFKIATRYYQLLFSGKLGFEKVAEFAAFPQINLGPFYFKFPDEDAEETFTVFDHPVIRIYKKIAPYSLNEYSLMFENETND